MELYSASTIALMIRCLTLQAATELMEHSGKPLLDYMRYHRQLRYVADVARHLQTYLKLLKRSEVTTSPGLKDSEWAIVHAGAKTPRADTGRKDSSELECWLRPRNSLRHREAERRVSREYAAAGLHLRL